MGVKAPIPASSYIQDGLIAMYDGIENAGAGQHSNSATTWKDLVGSNDLSLQGNLGWGSKYFLFDGSSYFFKDATNIADPITVEVVAAFGNTGYISWFQYKGTKMVHVRTVSSKMCACLTNTHVAHTYEFTNLVPSTISANYSNSQVCQNGSLLSTTGAGARGVTSATDNMLVGVTYYYKYTSYFDDKIYCIRLYSRVLTSEEIAFNHSIDVQRFGLETT